MEGVYLAELMTDVIEATYKSLLAESNFLLRRDTTA